MKLKNKKTGETGYYLHTHRDYKTGVLKVAVLKDGVPFSEFKPYEPIYDYDSLAELNKEWCDYEEPKDFWFIDPEILIACESTDPLLCDKKVAIETMKLIGNYFDSREEAEKAVEKLKAWKRLKDKGFRFDLSPALGHCDDKKFDISIIGTMPAKWWYNDKVVDDIHYIFGGEE